MSSAERRAGVVLLTAVSLFLYLVFAWPILVMGATYHVGPSVPLTWTPVLLSGLLVLLWVTRPDAFRLPIDLRVLGALLLYGWTTAIILLATDARRIGGATYTEFLVNHIAFGGALVIAGLHFRQIVAGLQSRWGRLVVAVAAVSLGLMVVEAARSNQLSGILPWYLVGVPKPEIDGSGFNYLFLSDALAIAGLMAVSQARPFWGKLAVVMVGAILLFWTHSRSAFGGFIVIGSVILFVHWLRLKFWSRLVIASGALAVAVALVGLVTPIFREVGGAPELERFNVAAIGEDESVVERGVIFETGIGRLEQQWVLGHFMDEVVQRTPGRYIHNWLSFWQAYGLVPFLLFVLLYGMVLWQVTLAYRHEVGQWDREFLFAVAWFLGLSITLSRSYGEIKVWFVLMAVPSALSLRTKRRLPALIGPTPVVGETNP